jgi:hypothetical protein
LILHKPLIRHQKLLPTFSPKVLSPFLKHSIPRQQLKIFVGLTDSVWVLVSACVCMADAPVRFDREVLVEDASLDGMASFCNQARAQRREARAVAASADTALIAP